MRVRDERWRVVDHHSYRECAVIEVAGADVTNRGVTTRYLVPFDRADRLVSRVGHPRVVTPVALRQAMQRALEVATPAWTSLRSPAAARLSLLAFQLEPALAITRGRATRLLLADDVGLGKTIQAGVILAEVRAREPDARAFIVTPAGLRDQWQDELSDRFGIAATVIDAAALARMTAQLPADVNPWSLPPVVITSIDFVKRPDVIRALESLVWDVVVFDEAHGLSGRSDRSAAAHLLASRGRRVLLLTATPHSGDNDTFARLCQIGALDGDPHPLVMFRRGRSAAGCTVSRRTRRLAVTPTDAEREMYDALEQYARTVRRHAPAAQAAGARLAMGVLARRACSSAASLTRSIERRLALLSGETATAATQLHLPLEDGADHEPMTELAAPGLADASAEQAVLTRILAAARSAAAHESKIATLQRVLRRCSEPVIVFTEYRDTLARVVTALGIPDAAILHGGLDPAERRRQIHRFTHGTTNLLLATDAASEGLNLHRRCRCVINLEVPWTPTRFEQRAGRVDRLGQSRRPHILTLAARDTFEDGVIARFVRRQSRMHAGAPFAAEATAASNPLLVLDDLSADADAEAARLRQVVALRQRRSPAGHRHRPGPPAAVLRCGRPGSLYWAFALHFLDDGGAPLWHATVAVSGHCNLDAARTRQHAKRLFTALTLASAPSIMRLVMETHAAHLARLAVELHAATGALASRDHAIDAAIRRERARLALPLLQPGLFDRRAARAAEAREHTVDAARAQIAERISALDLARCPREGERALVFLAAIGV